MKHVFVAALLAASATAHADARFEVLDHGDSVEVIGHDIMTARTIITAARSRLEIPLPPGALPVVKRVTPGDATVLLAEIDPDAHAVSVKLTLDHPGTVALARVSEAMQIGNDIHVLVPRKPEGVTLPEPTLPVVVTPDSKPATTADAKPATPPAPAAAATAPDLAKSLKPEPKPEPKPESKATQPAPLSSSLADEPGVNTSVLVGAALLAAAGGVWFWKRRKRTPAPVPVIDVIAQRALGGKARIVWLALGGREVIVAITPQQVSLLGAWPRGEGQITPVGHLAQPLVAASAAGSGPIPNIVVPSLPSLPRTITQNTASPAVNGILKLRERTAPPVADDVATDDIEADATWSRELLAATIAAHR